MNKLVRFQCFFSVEVNGKYRIQVSLRFYSLFKNNHFRIIQNIDNDLPEPRMFQTKVY